MTSTGSKLLIAIIVVIVIAGGVWYAMAHNSGPTSSNGDASQIANATMTPAPTIAPTPTPTPNTTIDEDIANIDAQLKAMDTDSKSVDASMNDKQVAQ